MVYVTNVIISLKIHHTSLILLLLSILVADVNSLFQLMINYAGLVIMMNKVVKCATLIKYFLEWMVVSVSVLNWLISIILGLIQPSAHPFRIDPIVTGSRQHGMWATDHPHKPSLLLSHLGQVKKTLKAHLI